MARSAGYVTGVEPSLSKALTITDTFDVMRLVEGMLTG